VRDGWVAEQLELPAVGEWPYCNTTRLPPPNALPRPPRTKHRDEPVTLDTLQALGFDSGRGRAILNCLSKLGRAEPQRAAGGGAVAYRLAA
jgi:hypothetical protein